ncbi:PaaX family transcriptional regulator C-terminal domain-containing protein [Pseudonocardia sp. GCM10023141]|uniref:PaaX family transcriptional regulator C-terminal domain-containing protein n=1 Tax=Pseudonocardia sp. GCM10023141 TaxID=3252653 RepID=UPI003620D876
MNEVTVTSEKVTSERPRRSRSLSLVAFLFGVADVDELPGLALVQLLGELGMSTSAARGLLARMRSDGQLATSRRGREVDYRMAGPFAATFRRLRDGGSRGLPSWEGHFHALVYQMPEEHRAYRDRLRRIAQLVGYGQLQPGILIAARDVAGEMAGVLAAAPTGVRVHRATLGFPTETAAEIARSTWELDALADTFRGHCTTLSAALVDSTPPPPTTDTLRTLARIVNDAAVDLIDDPRLPGALLPAGWPVAELGVLFERVNARFGPPAAQHVHAVIAVRSGSGR